MGENNFHNGNEVNENLKLSCSDVIDLHSLFDFKCSQYLTDRSFPKTKINFIIFIANFLMTMKNLKIIFKYCFDRLRDSYNFENSLRIHLTFFTNLNDKVISCSKLWFKYVSLSILSLRLCCFNRYF